LRCLYIQHLQLPDLAHEGRAEQILFGAVDEVCKVLNYCYRRFYGERGDYLMTPFDHDSESAIPGEGAAFFLLSKKKRTSKNYGAIESVITGNIADNVKELPEKTFCIINADGHRDVICITMTSYLMAH
jgi:3-oxoacyl-[acyl-carrier-protein] synthase II